MLGRLFSRLALLNAAAWTIIAVGVFGIVAPSSLSSLLRQGAAEASHGNVNVAVGSLFFGTTGSAAWNGTGDPGTFEETTIHVGDSVTWTPWSSFHTVTGCDPNTSWVNCDGDTPIGDSGVQSRGSWGPTTFSTAGEYPYLCTLHTGFMRGKIVVLAAPTPAPTPTPTLTPTATAVPTATPGTTATPTPTLTAPASPTATPVPTAVAEAASSPAPLTASLPAGGGPPPEPSGNATVWLAIIGGAAVALGLAALVVRRARDESRGQPRS